MHGLPECGEFAPADGVNAGSGVPSRDTIWARSVATCAARSAARAGLETGVPSRVCHLEVEPYALAGLRPACQSEDRRSRAGGYGDQASARSRNTEGLDSQSA